MIERISQLHDHGVFRNFDWPANLTDFGQYNLILGSNGTGKTTLSRLLRDLELRRTPAMGRVSLRIDGVDVSGDKFAAASVQIRVFNRDFVQESVFRKDGVDVPPIFVVGTESVEKQKEVERLGEERRKKEELRAKADALRTQAERELERHCAEQARVIKESLRVSGGRYNDYDRRNYLARAQKMVNDADVEGHRLDEQTRDALVSQHVATPKAKVQEVLYRPPKLEALAEAMSRILRETVVSETLRSLENDPTLSEWVHQGLGLHKSRTSESCLFCNQSLLQDRLAKLDGHFSNQYDQLLRRIDEQIREMEDATQHAVDLRVPDNAALFDSLVSEYKASNEALTLERLRIQAFLGKIIVALREKKSSPFTSVVLDVIPPDSDVGAVERINAVIQKHNVICDDFVQEVTRARDRLAEGVIAESLPEFTRLQSLAVTLKYQVAAIDTALDGLRSTIRTLERQIREHQRPAEELNENLKRYLGHGELQLTIKDTGYSISRSGVQATHLSDGEMAALSLLYFLKSLEDRGFDNRRGVVVIDDPVSSLDGNAVFLAFGLIRERTKNVGQLFLLTHDFLFFRQVRNWFHKMPGQRKPDVSQRPARLLSIECQSVGGVRAAALRWVDPLLERYESEYHFLFACVHRVWSSPPATSLEDYYHVPNMARRLLESFLAFKLPRESGELYNALLLVKFDETKKTRILRFLHTQSHAFDLVPGHDPTALGECHEVLRDLFALMMSLDAEHVAAMISIISPTPQPTVGLPAPALALGQAALAGVTVSTPNDAAAAGHGA